jgi:hypothetical protein
MYYTEGRINQSDKLVNVGLASRDAYGSAQRSGVPNKPFTKYHDDYTTLLDRGWQDEDGYVIVQRKLEFHNEYVKATYMATKDHNRLSEFKGVDQLYRWSEIPSSNQVNQRIEFYNDYLIALNPNSEYGLEEQVTKQYGQLSLYMILGTLNNDWYNSLTQGKTETTLAYIRTDGFLEEYPDDMTYQYAIATPVASYGIKGGFVFGFGFENNQVAGDGLLFDGLNYYNQAIRYTNKDGRFNELWFALANKYSNENDGYTEFERLSAYPLIRTADDNFGYLLDTYFRCGYQDPTDSSYDALIIEKDTSQSIKISYQNTVESYEYLKFVFGQKFYTENFIVKNPIVDYNVIKGTPKYLYRYENGTKYGKFDDLKVKIGYSSKTLLTNSNSTIIADRLIMIISMIGVTSWAIGDNEGNLYLACNDNWAGIRFIKRHFRPNIYEIGNKNESQSINMHITLSDNISVVSVMTTIHPNEYFDSLEDEIIIIDTMTLIQSTDFVISLSDTIQASSNLQVIKFEFPIAELSSLITLSDQMTLIQSTDYVISMGDIITVTSGLGMFVSDNYLMEISSVITLVDEMEITQSTDFVIQLEDVIEVDSTVNDIMFQFVYVDLLGTIALVDTIDIIQSTNYSLNITGSVTLSDTMEIIKSTDFVITLDDTITVSSTVVAQQVTQEWVFIGTSGSYDQSVSYVAEGSTCVTSSVARAWLQTNYPADNYAYGYIMRVARANENLSPCTPTSYYYQAT